ncbi:hypothetical protein ASC77_10840 [Nocardioides sp. Root1257]|uniref:outer membrane protein assembly factor BamB family protein n=1 Tax=unclassified Nocardioides TaxID=2615069 RepID=UPI0006F7B6B4|nr:MULTISPECIES: PQQ-binding-like beta-propeller repeat protein [unclassified Nocardioides]KQW49180.1 hypothetical protein ASC77_10840 [Nocardioides sp. Root1257]KRC48354.1 hypothetical protein ASE24_10845 [Nocardioides sp. Root224]
MGDHDLTRRRAAVATIAALTVVLTAACSGDGSEPEGDKRPQAEASASPTFPPNPDLPDPVDTNGPITEPLLEPVWLIRSARTDESDDYDVRSQALFVDGDVAVYQAQDTMLGISMTDGSTLWKSPVDMHGELPDYTGTSAHGDHRWSFVYPETAAKDLDAWGDRLVTIDTRTGEVVDDILLGSYGAATAMRSDGDVQYLATEDGLGVVNDDGSVHTVVWLQRLPGKHPEIVGITPIDGSDVVSLAINTNNVIGTDVIAGVDPTTGKVLWTHPVTDFARGQGADYVDLSLVDGRYVTRNAWDSQSQEMLHLWVLDPDTGKIRAHQLAKPSTNSKNYHQMRIGVNDLGSGNPHGMVVVGDEIIFEDFHGISRYRPLTGEYVWTRRVDIMGLRHGDVDWVSFGIGGLSPDGTLLYTSMSSGQSGDLLAIDVETGEVAGRWALDDAQDAGLVGRPLMVLDGDQLVLARNRSVEGDPELMEGPQKPLGPRNDVGLVRFPELAS